MQKQSLSTYFGGFLLNAPCPLELSLNYCLHSCPECFANLNAPERKAHISQALGLLKNSFLGGKLTLEKYLIRNGYPIQFSNHVDPFSGVKKEHPLNNYTLTLPLLELMHDLDVACTIQTKGGLGLLEPCNYHCSALDLIKVPTVFYVSLETLDNDVGKRSAPGAPSPTDRLALIETLIGQGHRVCVGVNPVVPQWLPDPELMISTLHGLGVEGIWVQALHLSDYQISKMPNPSRKRLGEEIINQAKPRNHAKYPAIAETLAALRSKANHLGLAVYDSQQAERTDYFKPYFETYPTRYPMMQELTNWAWDNLKHGDLIYFDTWADMMLQRLPEGVWPIGQHIGAVAGVKFWSQVRHLKVTNKMTYRELLRLIWDWKESVLCPVNTGCFRWAGDYEKQADGTMGWTRWLDSNKQPILVFDPECKDLLWSQQYL